MRDLMQFLDGNVFGAMAMDVVAYGDGVAGYTHINGTEVVINRNTGVARGVNKDGKISEEFNFLASGGKEIDPQAMPILHEFFNAKVKGPRTFKIFGWTFSL